MLDAGGVGLAAPQVRVPLRLVIFQLPPERLVARDSTDGTDADIEGNPEGDAEGAATDPEHLPLHVLINPVITPVGEETAAQFLPRIVRDPPRVWVAAALLRRARVGHLDFRASDEPATDIMFWMRVALEGTIVYDPQPTACMRVTEGYSSESQFLAIDERGRLPPATALATRLPAGSRGTIEKSVS